MKARAGPGEPQNSGLNRRRFVMTIEVEEGENQFIITVRVNGTVKLRDWSGEKASSRQLVTETVMTNQ